MFVDAFPLEPPKLRLVSPQITGFWVQSKGAICLEILNPTGWSPVATLEKLCLHVK